MASSSTPIPSNRIYEGVFAIHKPLNISSAQVIRDVQAHFKSSKLFQPWFECEQARKDAESHNQKRKRRSWKERQPIEVKMGHGGTLDPMATGVLILGVGSGTKQLSQFLECTKSYDATVLFGAATDSYDAVGKIIARKPYHHVTENTVENALNQFRGKIMQRPPIFSALKVQGKKLYEYAREGKQVPIEIEERPVEVQQLEMLGWLEGRMHNYHWPTEEAPELEKQSAEKTFHLEETKREIPNPVSATKRKRGEEGPDGNIEADAVPSPKRSKSSPPPLPSENVLDDSKPANHDAQEQQPSNVDPDTQSPCPAPACRLRMTVTSGFYVRSLCHDLGAAVDSLALMADLVRTRQGDFELGKNVLEYDDFAQGEDHWAPKVQAMLGSWQDQSTDEQPRGDRSPRRVSRERRSPAEPARPAKMRRENTSSEDG